ncbi:MAG: NADP-dependent oxidoreductase [Porticoccaceae bacterium]
MNNQVINRKIVLNRRPQGHLRDGDLSMVSGPVRELNQGEFLLKTLWLSLDPYMRPRMSEIKNYLAPIGIGKVIVGETVSEVVASKSEKFKPGDVVTCFSGWQEYYVASEDTENIYRVKDRGLPLSVFLGSAGMTGRTAYSGLNFIGKPKAGETLVVSAAAGSVGSVVGQLAKAQGCRTVGIAGGAEKCTFIVDEMGFDAAVDYRAGNLASDLAQACPDGIDIYFENVGGDVAKAIAPLLNKGARVPICGYVSAYNAPDLNTAETPMDIFGALPEPPEYRYFQVREWHDQYHEITALLTDKVLNGEIKYRETIAQGLDSAEAAFIGMLSGANLGKQLVKVAK